MACFTRLFKKINFFEALSCAKALALAVFVCTMAFVEMAWATDSHLHIKSAELSNFDNGLALDATIDLQFDKDIEEAINKGVPLEFLLQFTLQRERNYWFNEDIAKAKSRVILSFHALSRQYLVSRGSQQIAFETLSEAKQNLVKVANWNVVDQVLLDKEETYIATLKMGLDIDKLPKVIQVEASGSKDWERLISPIFQWSFKEVLK